MFHGRFSAHGVFDHTVSIISGAMSNTLALVLRVALKTEGLRATKVSVSVDFSLGLRVDSTLRSLGSSASLDKF